jgi:hypothetical protein
MDIQDEEYYNTYRKYYSLKSLYETKNETLKKNVLKSYETLENKKKAISKIQYKCINCKQSGGTIFSDKDNILTAICGNSIKPCKLYLKINKGNVNILDEEIEKKTLQIKNFKNDIILLKLDYLFNYISQEESIKKFENIKEQLSVLYEKYNKELKSYYSITNNVEINNIIETKQLELYILIDEFKKIVDLYKNTREINYIKDAIEIYINKIITINNDISEFQYQKQFLQDEDCDSIFSCKKLYQLKYIKSELEIIENKKIVSFNI